MSDMISREAVLNLIRVNRTVSISKHPWAENVLREAFDELKADVERKPEVLTRQNDGEWENEA